MALACEICGKTKVVGKSQKHRRGVAGKRWKKAVTATPRLFKPNLQKATVVVGGKKQQMRLCTKCIKRIKKYGAIKDYSKIAVL
jgi:large subunit ribosomal protein L28